MDETDRTIRRLRVDARSMQEDAEEAVAELARSTRTLRDAVLDTARNGSEMSLDVGGVRLSGRVIHVGEGMVRLARSDRAPIDVAISAIGGIQARPPTQPGATVSVGYPATLIARCRELVQTQADIEVGRAFMDAVSGELCAVTATHLELAAADGSTWFVPMGQVAWVERVQR